MKPMKLGLFLAVVTGMVAIGLFFRYLNNKPENVINHVILAVRQIEQAHATENSAAKEAAMKKLNENVDRLKTRLDEMSDTPAEVELVAVEIVDRLFRENVTTLENAPERREHVIATH